MVDYLIVGLGIPSVWFCLVVFIVCLLFFASFLWYAGVTVEFHHSLFEAYDHLMSYLEPF